jgi:hypothetical protein
LSNEEFEGFDESKRIPVKLEEPDFITLRKLMDMADEIDSDFFEGNLQRRKRPARMPQRT